LEEYKHIMKLKNKLILGAASLLVISGVATGTSAYAWYTATRVNQVTFTSKAYSTSTGISLVLDSSRTDTEIPADAVTTHTGDTSDTAIEAKSTKHITDTSYKGDGGTAHKPSVSSSDNTMANGWFTTTTASASLHKFTYLVKSSGVTKVNLYLSPLSSLTAATTTENAALRFSMVYTPVSAYTDDKTFTGTDASAVLRAYAAPNANLAFANYKYLVGDDTLTDAAPKALTELNATAVDSAASTTSKKIIDESLYFARTANYLRTDLNDTGDLDSAGTSNVGYIATLDPTKTDGTQCALVTFYVWVEGTVTTGNVTDYTLSANFNFYTLAAAK
jgi:hypothetical protein